MTPMRKANPADPAVLFIRRVAAYVIDGVLIFVFVRPESFVKAWFGNIDLPAYVWCRSVAVLTMTAYYVGGHWRFGRTLGKGMLGLRVVNAGGEAPSLKVATLRYVPFFAMAVLFDVVDIFELPIGWVTIGNEQIDSMRVLAAAWIISEVIAAVATRGSGSLHDAIAHTMVVDAKALKSKMDLQEELRSQSSTP